MTDLIRVGARFRRLRVAAGKLMPRKWLAGLVPLLAVAAFTVAPSTAMANYHVYCDQTLVYGGTCPPEGSSKWWHMEENVAHDPYGSHYTCVDDFLDPNGSGWYTTQKCSYSYPEDWPGGVWGYPRAWNGEGKRSIMRGLSRTLAGLRVVSALRTAKISWSPSSHAVFLPVKRRLTFSPGVSN